MSLRKSPILTPARLAANRRNAQKSTGPRTAQGKSQSRMNSLKGQGRSALMRGLYLSLFNAPPGAVDRVAGAILTLEQAAHPKFREVVDTFRQADIEVAAGLRETAARYKFYMSQRGGGATRKPARARVAPPARRARVSPKANGKKSSKNNERSLNVIENTRG
jgi:hypothetical protein